MASYIKTLKEDNGDITYPQTLGSAVLLTGGADLETELAGKASSSSVAGKIDIGDVQSSDIVSNAVTTAKIADGAVTSAKIDWASIKYATGQTRIGTWIDDSPIYRVVFTGTTGNNNSETISNISIPNFSALLNCYGSVQQSDGKSVPIPRISAGGVQYQLGISDINSSSFYFEHPASSYKQRPYIVVIEYIGTA